LGWTFAGLEETVTAWVGLALALLTEEVPDTGEEEVLDLGTEPDAEEDVNDPEFVRAAGAFPPAETCGEPGFFVSEPEFGAAAAGALVFDAAGIVTAVLLVAGVVSPVPAAAVAVEGLLPASSGLEGTPGKRSARMSTARAELA